MSAAASASFSSIDATESEEKDLSVNLISSAREKFLSAKGFVRISARVTVEVTARRVSFSSRPIYRNKEIGIGSDVLNIINERRGIETNDLVLFDGAAELKRVPIHRAASRCRRRSLRDCPRSLYRDRAGEPP